MKFISLFILLTIPLAHAGSLPTCEELGATVQEVERQYSKKIPKDCQKLDVKTSIPSATLEQQSLFKEFQCRDLSEIELRLSTIESDLALIEGIKKLKEEIESDKKNISQASPLTAQEAAKSFIENLQVAKHLELLLNTTSGEGSFLHYLLKNVGLDKWETLGKLKSQIKRHCEENPPEEGEIDICHKEFNPDENTFKEIRAFVALGAETDGQFSTKHIDDLEKVLSISKGDEEYSFMAMYLEVKDHIKPDGTLSSGSIKAIQNLPSITFDEKKYSYLNNEVNPLLGMNRAKASMLEQKTAINFKYFLDDLKNRQDWEMKAKLSVVMDQFKTEIEGNNLQETCANVIKEGDKVENCLISLRNAVPNSHLRSLYLGDVQEKSGMIGEILAAQDQSNSLKDKLNRCVPDKQYNYPEDCFTAVLTQESEIIKKAQVLKALRDQILKENNELERYRSFVIESFKAKNCDSSLGSNISDCYGALESGISMESIVLYQDINSILVMQKNKSAETDIDDICLDEQFNPYNKDKICALFNHDENEDDTSATYHAPTNTGKGRNGLGSAVGETIGKIGQYAAGLLRPPYQTQMYPGPMLPTGPALTISTRTMISGNISASASGLGGMGSYPSAYFKFP